MVDPLNPFLNEIPLSGGRIYIHGGVELNAYPEGVEENGGYEDLGMKVGSCANGKCVLAEDTQGHLGKSGSDQYTQHLHWEIFNIQHYSYITNWGLRNHIFTRSYMERTHFDPIEFMNFRNGLLG